MATTFLPTKFDQDSSNARLAYVAAKLDSLELAIARDRAIVRVHLNAAGQTYSVPTDSTQVSEILNGAKIVLKIQGINSTYEAQITRLTAFNYTFEVPVTTAAKLELNSVGAVLGKSATCAYYVAADQFYLHNGDVLDIYLNSTIVTGTLVEMCRVQPWTANPQGSADQRLKLGNSYLGTRITTSAGSILHLGHWTVGQTDWVDESLTRVKLFDCPAGGTPVERVITTAADTTGWVDLDDRLACIRDIKIGTVTFDADSVTVGDNRIVRYSPLWVKQTFETVNMPVADENGVLHDNYVQCVVRWYCDTQADAGYHLHPIFEKHVRNADDTYSVTPCAHGYIARYPFGNSVRTAVSGRQCDVYQFKSGAGREWVPGSRGVTLDGARIYNEMTAKLYFDDDDDGTEELFATLPPDATNRTWGVAGTAEISFMQWMAYLYFGVNVQGAASEADQTNNIFPGICTSTVAATTNGATDALVEAGVLNGAENTRSCLNSIVFMGVEDGLWSSTGWYWEDVTLVSRRTITTDTNGAISTNVESSGWLFAEDAADADPDAVHFTGGARDLSNETTDNDEASFEGWLKLHGYREASFTGSTGLGFRMGADTSPVLRDAALFAAVQDQHGLNIGECDNFWRGGSPGNLANFSASTAYALGEFVVYDGKVWKCTATHAAGEWDSSHFAIFASGTVVRRSYWLVALGDYRAVGAGLGSFPVTASLGLSFAGGTVWRARPFLRVVS